MATIRPIAVLYSAIEMPCASWIGFDAVELCEPKISIMPTTVPKSPSSGDIAAMVPSVVRKRSRSCVTTRPTSSMASFMTGRGAFTFARPAARMRPSGPCAAVLREQLGRGAGLPEVDQHACPPCPAGATTDCRSDHRRSNISASATMDAKISGQIGQPAAWIRDHTR